MELFHVWKYNKKLVIKSRKILKTIEGLEIELVFCLATLGGTIHHLPPIELGSKDEFQQNYRHALIIIANCLNNSQVFHISSCNTYKETWDEVFNLFEVHDSMTKMYLMEWLTVLKMKENETVIKHVHNFKSFSNNYLWLETR
jgi:hypothetical protein